VSSSQNKQSETSIFFVLESDDEVLESRLIDIFNSYEDKQSLSFKKVKEMYTERFSELEGSDSKVAKKLVVKLYMEYQASLDEATVLTENKPVKRPREKPEDMQASLDEVEDKENVPLNKPAGKKQKMDASAALEVRGQSLFVSVRRNPVRSRSRSELLLVLCELS
jgi:hypothetical protein